MIQKEFEYSKNGTKYRVFVSYKRQKNVYFRFKEDAFYVSAPYRTSNRFIASGLDKFFDKLVNRPKEKIEHYSLEKKHIYLLGNKMGLDSLNIKDNEDLPKYLKYKALEVITFEVRNYEQIMGIKNPYKIKVKNTLRQYGSNSKRTHTLSFQISLIHYSLDIIDSVVVHELAHEFERNHQKGFYEIVYKYCPNYKTLHKKLRKGIHK